MRKDKTRTIPHRRRREGRTNYKKRISLLKSRTTRVIIRRFNGNMLIQLINYAPNGDNVILTTSTKELKKYDWKLNKGNIPSSYLVGYLCGKKAQNMKVKEAIVDLGLQIPNKKGRIFAAIKGLKDAGLNINCPEDAFPSEERLSGKHMESYFESNSKEKGDKTQFSLYTKNKVVIKDISKMLDTIKEKIDKEGGKV